MKSILDSRFLLKSKLEKVPFRGALLLLLGIVIVIPAAFMGAFGIDSPSLSISRKILSFFLIFGPWALIVLGVVLINSKILFLLAFLGTIDFIFFRIDNFFIVGSLTFALTSYFVLITIIFKAGEMAKQRFP